MGKFNEYTQKATPADNDTMMIYDAAAKANKLSPFSGIWNWIVGKLTNAVISNLQTSNKSVIGALNELHSNRLRSAENITSASDLAEDVLIKCDYGEIRLFTIQSTVSINQGSPDGKGGFLLVYQSKAGSKYGIVVLFSYSEAIWMKTKSTTWGEWKCLNTAEILSNLTTTNKSSLVGAINELNSKQSKTISVSNVTDIQTLVNSATGGTNILFHLAGAGYTGSDLPNDTKYKYGSGIIFFRNSNSCKIVLFPEEVKPVWKMSNWTKWKDFANSIVD